MVATSSSATVARIAYLASDVLVDSRPSLPSTSKFAATLQSLSQFETKPLFSLPSGADPGATLLRYASSSLVSYTTSSQPELLNRLLVHLPELVDSPIVLHVSVEDDLSDVLVFRSSVPFVLFSRTAQQAHDNALLASRLARLERKPVLHIFVNTEGDVKEVDSNRVPSFLLENSQAVVNGTVLPSDEYVPKLFDSYFSTALFTSSLVKRSLQAFAEHGSSEPHTVIFTLGQPSFQFDLDGILFVDISLVNPLPASQITSRIPASVSRVFVVEQVRRWSTKWTPLYLEIVSAIQQEERDECPTVHSVVLEDGNSVHTTDILKLLQHASTESPSKRLQLGSSSASQVASATAPHVPKHESSYLKILNQLFGERLQISNSPELVPSQGQVATTPEFALGRVRGEFEQREELVTAVKELLQGSVVTPELHELLSKWLLAKDDTVKSGRLGEEIIKSIEAGTITGAAATRVLALRSHFPVLSRWILGSDAWSYDLGASGLHHAIASKLNVNILLLDSVPYSARNVTDPSRRKHDVGLYAMNHGDVYVASVAVYSSYSQVLHALIEADRFDGPSVILAYLPYKSEEDPALDLLKETKLAVDTGYWPLYRWDPSKEAQGKEPFTLDSDAVKNDLQQFLDRQNHLSQLVRSKPQLAAEIVSSLGENVKEARRKRAQQSYADLLTSIDAPPLLVLYASDGGTAEKVARRVTTRAKLRGLSASVATMDSTSVDDLAKEEYVVFVTSVAGQGEFPQNGRALAKTLNGLAARGEKLLTNLKYSVFGMGDSHYWPRPEDAHFYNKAGKDLDARLEQLGGERIADLGLGDDQDADGYNTGYNIWEPLIWKALGVDSIQVYEKEPEVITNEHIKVASQYLRGTIAEGLQDFSTGALAPSDTQLTKFHGIYQQDDRDIRDERTAQGVEPAYAFMIRVRMPGGVCTSEQWLAMDQIADEHGNGSMKITTRQTFQFHGVIKRHLKKAIQDINRVLLDTLAACGDVNRLAWLFTSHYFGFANRLVPGTSFARPFLPARRSTGRPMSLLRRSASTSFHALLRTTRSGSTRS
jgi:sulfite reductase (NADPH) hemoprotein beta-component